MNNLERFLAVARFEKPDYVPIFGFPGAPGMSNGAMKHTHQRMIDTGMPAHVGGRYEDWSVKNLASWRKFWGTTGPSEIDFGMAKPCRGFKTTHRIEGGFEVIESENGELTRQVIDNANTYSMPEFVRYPVRDRASWEFYKERVTPPGSLSREEVELNCRRFDNRTEPLAIGASGVYGFLRNTWGDEAVGYALYDFPDLVHEMCAWQRDMFNRYTLPLIERLKPEIVYLGEDLCYNHGMLLSPKAFDEFCGPYYKIVCDCAKAAKVPVISVDSDGNVMEYVDCATGYGINSVHPFEVKAGNDLFALRKKHPRFISFGWLEKEVVNEGNESMIRPEILSKVPPLLEQGGYFPNGDHGIQPFVTYTNLRKFMTLLHEVCGNPEGDFPRLS